MSDVALPLDALAARANAAHLEAERLAVGALVKARESGEALRAAKEQLPHGEWGRWLHENFSGSVRTAQTYMQIAARWPEIEANTQRVAHLSLRQAAALLCTPQEASPGEASGPDEPLTEAEEQRLAELEAIIEAFRQEHGQAALDFVASLVLDEKREA